MKICICGQLRDEILTELKKEHNEYTVINTEITFTNFPAIDYMITLYEHPEDNVIFNGGIFDGYISFKDNGGTSYLQDQLILSYIQGVDKIIINTKDASSSLLNTIREYESLYPKKIEMR